ncbi:MAG: hypothetical protein C5B50_00470 [Verrucomicrobia bacterium]|nr:MAG: hypothetical protein C5B50_00470 [Verrucomicrobiota bacterium]
MKADNVKARGNATQTTKGDYPGILTANPSTSSWPITMWPEVRDAADGREQSLSSLVLKYQRPLRMYLLSAFSGFPQITKDADDLLQGFAKNRILRDGWLGKANPAKGKFRDFLKTSLRNYVINEATKAKPSGISLAELEEGGTEPAAPEKEKGIFEEPFIQDILKQTLEHMEQDCKAPERPQPHGTQIWDLFVARIRDPIFKNTDPPSYQQLVVQFGLKSPTEGTNMLLTAKRLFKRHLTAVVAEYAGEKGVQAELDFLTDFISKLAGEK